MGFQLRNSEVRALDVRTATNSAGSLSRLLCARGPGAVPFPMRDVAHAVAAAARAAACGQAAHHAQTAQGFLVSGASRLT